MAEASASSVPARQADRLCPGGHHPAHQERCTATRVLACRSLPTPRISYGEVFPTLVSESRAAPDAVINDRAWLLGIGRNVLLEHLKKVQNRKEVAWTELCLRLEQLIEFKDDDTRYVDVLPHLPACLESLGPSTPASARRCSIQENLSIVQIGDRLRRSVGAVKLLMFRARQALKLCSNGKCQPSGPG